MSRECPQNSHGGDDGKVREIYVPKQSDDASLFENCISTGINFAKYENIPVKVSGENIPSAIADFETAGLRPILLENIKKSGYTVPTPIQKRTLPIVMAGRDLMACAQTGSGKTAAFLLPVIHKLISTRAGDNAGSGYAAPQCVVITPTRELAIQIKDESRKFAMSSGVKSVVTYGGASIQYQLAELVRGCNILIATPGRLHDLVNRGKISFESVQFLILDEADRMLDMGFMPDIQRCVLNPKMPKKGVRQTLMFSATFPPEIQRSAKEFLHNQLFVTVGVVGGACTDVTQNFYEVSKFEKREKLKEILTACSPEDRTLVFVKTKKNADFIATYLSHQGLPTTSIHGDRLQREREQALFDFRNGKMPILVATDVAARGLDIKGVKHVVNFDMPDGVDDYVHRIGRTGRVGNVGKASSFYDSSEDRGVVGPLVKMLTDCKQKVPTWLAREAGGYRGGYGAGAEDNEDW